MKPSFPFDRAGGDDGILRRTYDEYRASSGTQAAFVWAANIAPPVQRSRPNSSLRSFSYLHLTGYRSLENASPK